MRDIHTGMNASDLQTLHNKYPNLGGIARAQKDLTLEDPFKALYIHVPFCQHKCSYCDFHSCVPSNESLLDVYVEQAILSMRRLSKAELLGSIQTVYLGGGTPSYLGLKRIGQLLYTLSLSMHLTTDVECTMEANPESLTDRMVRDIWALGVNRLSMGVQSFDDSILRLLGRVHTADKAKQAIEIAHQRFENVSIDLMCGIPGQTFESCIRDVQCALDMGVTHISIYPLTIEEGTVFDRMERSGMLAPIQEDDQAQAMVAMAELLESAGFKRYEIASYARPGYECEHNKAYWKGLPYIGIGEGAVSMEQNATRRIRTRLTPSGCVTDDELSYAEYKAEDIMLAMRMTQGLTKSAVAEASKEFNHIQRVFERLVQEGLLADTGTSYQPTRRGWLLGNELFEPLMNLCEEDSY